MSRSLPEPWIKERILEILRGPGHPVEDEFAATLATHFQCSNSSKIVQVVKVYSSLNAFAVNDKNHLITVMLTTAAAESFRSEYGELETLKNSLVKLKNYHFSTAIQCSSYWDVNYIISVGIPLPLVIQCDSIQFHGNCDLAIIRNPQEINRDSEVYAILSTYKYIQLHHKLSKQFYGQNNELPDIDGLFLFPSQEVGNGKNVPTIASCLIPSEQQLQLRSFGNKFDHSDILRIKASFKEKNFQETQFDSTLVEDVPKVQRLDTIMYGQTSSHIALMETQRDNEAITIDDLILSSPIVRKDNVLLGGEEMIIENQNSVTKKRLQFEKQQEVPQTQDENPICEEYNDDGLDLLQNYKTPSQDHIIYPYESQKTVLPSSQSLLKSKRSNVIEETQVDSSHDYLLSNLIKSSKTDDLLISPKRVKVSSEVNATSSSKKVDKQLHSSQRESDNLHTSAELHPATTRLSLAVKSNAIHIEPTQSTTSNYKAACSKLLASIFKSKTIINGVDKRGNFITKKIQFTSK